MTHLNVPPWCRTLIEQSNDAYILIENDKIAFLNEKATSLLSLSFSGVEDYIGREAFWENDRLIISPGQNQKKLAVYSNSSDFVSDRHEEETSTFEKGSIELLYTDHTFKLFRLKETLPHTDQLPESEQCYFSLFNTVDDAVFIQYHDGTIIEANQGAERMFGYPKSFFKGKKMTSFGVYTEEDIENIKIRMGKVFLGEPQKFESWGKRSNGEAFPKEVSMYNGSYIGKNVFIAIVSDITENKQSKAQLETYTLQLQELIETRDKIYSIVAHDLRSSFSSILGLSELLTEDWESIEDSRKQIFAKNIFIAADGSYKLLQNLLDWSKNQSGLLEYEPVSFDMCGVINEILSLYRIQSLQKNISIQSEVVTPTFVFADVNMVQSILRNLVSNSIKFTPVNGKVWITKNEINAESVICFSVHDNGVGISKDRIAKLFDSKINSTTTGTANEQGTGLGILICKEMAEKNNGKLWVESEDGAGTTFSFTLHISNH